MCISVESLDVEKRNRSFRLRNEISRDLSEYSENKSLNKSRVVSDSLKYLFKDYFFFKDNFNYKKLSMTKNKRRDITSVNGFILNDEDYENLKEISKDLDISKSILLEYSIEQYINKEDYTKVIDEKEDALFRMWSAQYLQCEIDR